MRQALQPIPAGKAAEFLQADNVILCTMHSSLSLLVYYNNIVLSPKKLLRVPLILIMVGKLKYTDCM